MTLQLANAVRRLLAAESGDLSSTEVATRAARASEQWLRRLSPLLGETAVRVLFQRSVRLASASFPWLLGATAKEVTGGPAAALGASLEAQAPQAAAEAFVAVLSTYIGLLGKLIGDGLTARVLHEVWPAVFPDRAREFP